MDFHSLARRDLQALCKKNKIAANQTNVAMADALQALQSIEWDEEVRQKLMPQSEPLELHGSPLPRSRRVSAVSGDISSFPVSDEVDEMKEALIEAIQTPVTAVRRSQRIQSAMGTRTRARTSAAGTGTGAGATGTRASRSKKEEASAEAAVVAAATPAPQRGRKKAMETPAPVPRSSARPTRQSTRKLPESTKGTRVTRTMESLMALEANDVKEAHAEVNEVPETEQAKEEQVADEKLDLVEENVEQIDTESTEEIVAEESEISAALPVSEEKDVLLENPLENSTGTDEAEKSLEEELTSEITDQKEVPSEKSVEDVADVGPDTNIAPISEEGQVDLEMEEGQVNETALTDSPIMGLVSEAVPESNSDLQDAPPCDITLDAQDVPPCDITLDAQDDPPCDITLDAQDAPPCDITLDVEDAPPCDIITPDAQEAVADLSFASPVRAPNNVGVERMLDSVVRRFAKASINSAKKTDATEKAATVVEPLELAQNENAVKEKVDLQNMSLRKLKAMYKDRLIELNSKKVVAEEGKRLPLGNLDENIQGNNLV